MKGLDRLSVFPDFRDQAMTSGVGAFKAAVEDDPSVPDRCFDPDVRKIGVFRNGGEKKVSGDSTVAHFKRLDRAVSRHIDL